MTATLIGNGYPFGVTTKIKRQRGLVICDFENVTISSEMDAVLIGDVPCPIVYKYQHGTTLQAKVKFTNDLIPYMGTRIPKSIEAVHNGRVLGSADSFVILENMLYFDILINKPGVFCELRIDGRPSAINVEPFMVMPGYRARAHAVMQAFEVKELTKSRKQTLEEFFFPPMEPIPEPWSLFQPTPEPVREPETCPCCRGKGTVGMAVAKRRSLGVEVLKLECKYNVADIAVVYQAIQLCPECGGTGRQ